MSDDRIDGLARQQGIEPRYRDNWGRTHEVPRATHRALLAAIGFPVDDPAALEVEIAARRAAEWDRLLPPVVVARCSAPAIEIPLRLPLSRAHERFGWELIEEGGRRRRGLFAPAELPRVERCEVAGVQRICWNLVLPGLAETGYHALHVAPLSGVAPAGGSMRLIVVPERCYRPAAVGEGKRVWGPAVQLYALRSEHNWGVGDFTDLTRLVEIAAGAGADIVTVSPLHLLFPSDPGWAAPYSPSSRSLLDVIYLDVEAIPDFEETGEAWAIVEEPGFRERLARLRRAGLVDRAEVWKAKLPVIEASYRGFRRRHLKRSTERGRAFRRFVEAGGESLRAYGAFECLHERFRCDWRSWPVEFRSPDRRVVARVGQEDRDRVELFLYMQWQATEQLEAVGRRSLELGLGVGLGLDLALGTHGSGFDAWYRRGLADGASIGAPPDAFSPGGQDWGLPPPVPSRMTAEGYASFIVDLRAGMRHAGALRIDHVMSLMRLFWVPAGGSPADGAYVRYPLDDLLGIVALESCRQRCMVVGEDLGTVPPELRHSLAAMDALSSRLLYFMKDPAGDFVPPQEYPENALVAVTTHDLPTIAGWWSGREIELRESLGLLPPDVGAEEQRAGRAVERDRLMHRLREAGLLPAETGDEISDEIVLAIHRWLARSPSCVLTLQLEDLLGVVEQTNLPGTTGDKHPNWQRRLPLSLERLEDEPRWRALAGALREERSRR